MLQLHMDQVRYIIGFQKTASALTWHVRVVNFKITHTLRNHNTFL